MFLIVCLSWLAVLSIPPQNLRIIACNVGQGDAIIVTYGNTQALIDGGPGNKVISCLSRYMPFWDRTIELVVLTHPDADHATGLVEVFKNYNVKIFVTTNIKKETNVYSALNTKVKEKRIKTYYAKAGDTLVSGKLYFDIFHPKEIPPEADKVNLYSIVIKMSFLDFNALFTGDIEDAECDYISDVFDLSGIEYLKVPHHGSKNGLSQKMLNEIKPQIAVISLGKNNFGHPHQEVLDMLANSNTKVLRTDKGRDVVLETNGSAWWLK